jgi:Protein of unknown function (DUF3303)
MAWSQNARIPTSMDSRSLVGSTDDQHQREHLRVHLHTNSLSLGDWRERPAASARDYEAAHERVLEIFKDWKMPASFSVLQFVVRIGDYGGYMIVETDKPTDIHYVTSFFAVFEFKVEPVVDVMDAVAVEVKAIEYRKKNFS